MFIGVTLPVLTPSMLTWAPVGNDDTLSVAAKTDEAAQTPTSASAITKRFRDIFCIAFPARTLSLQVETIDAFACHYFLLSFVTYNASARRASIARLHRLLCGIRASGGHGRQVDRGW